jgi:FAD/FMN-containing dehydrogenase
MTRTRIRRWTLGLVIALLLVAGALVGRPAYLWIRAGLRDRPVAHDLPSGYIDDASRLNSTHVAEIFSIPAEPAAAEAQLRTLLQRARAERLSVAIAGARHSMGGHTIAPDGIVLDMLPFKRMELDAEKRILSVGAGARWSEVIPYLDARGFSVAVMQSNNNFSVGGSISVNCHGWQHNHAPIASTVDSLRLMKADGTIVRCSRDENAELFGLVLGGYGLFGVILDVNLRVVPNERYRAEIDSDAGKEVRWKAERQLGERFAAEYVSRNQLLNEEAEVYQDRNEERPDILHEYFIPPHRVGDFLAWARRIIPQHGGDLLNVTVRNVHEDRDTFLRYADRDLFALVMLFNQPRTPNADSRMEAMTRELIDAALEADGRYYLPYRLHATKDQFARAYPQAVEFFERKRHYDPEEIFRTRFYLTYGRP